jgi:hypothetical protein
MGSVLHPTPTLRVDGSNDIPAVKKQEKTSKFAVIATKIRLEERDKQGTFAKDADFLAERAKTRK